LMSSGPGAIPIDVIIIFPFHAGVEQVRRDTSSDNPGTDGFWKWHILPIRNCTQQNASVRKRLPVPVDMPALYSAAGLQALLRRGIFSIALAL
jgi:hypothetical protein